MKKGYGKQKGGAFERAVAELLSRWISGGAHKDLLWRTAMSGGRATVSRGTVRQAGDLTAVAPEGHILTDHNYIECKHMRDLGLKQLLTGGGIIRLFWIKACDEAEKYNRHPTLIVKENNLPTLLITSSGSLFYHAAEKERLPHARIRWASELQDSYVFQFKHILLTPFPQPVQRTRLT